MAKALYINLWSDNADRDHVESECYTDQGEALDRVNEGRSRFQYAGTLIVDGADIRREDYSIVAEDYARKQTAEWRATVSTQRRPGL